jgi:hypothetical protein
MYTFDFFPISENGIIQLSISGRRAVVQHVILYNSLGTKFKKNWCSLNFVSTFLAARDVGRSGGEENGGRIKCGTTRSFK